MFTLIAHAVEENTFTNKETGEITKLYKVYFKNANGGFFCIWTPKAVEEGSEVVLNIVSDNQMKPVLKIAS